MAFVALGLTARAATNAVAEKPGPALKKKAAIRGVAGVAVLTGAGSAGAALLVNAYHQLESADHDYHGHRVRAMRQIENAARLLGANVHGDGHDREKQGLSDEHLRQAESMLSDATGRLAGRPLRHVREALNQLTIALNVK